MNDLFTSPFFSVVLCIFAYSLGVYLNRITKSPVANPLLIAIIISIGVLKTLGITFEQFNEGASIITLFLAPATACLAVSIYAKREVLKKYWIPIISGTVIGSLASISSVILLCRFWKLTPELTASMIPKSVTTPIAIEIASSRGGIGAVTVAAVIFTGILGAVFAPIFIKILKIKNPIAQGVAIGTSSHAVGTSKAIEMGEVQGAMSGIAIGLAGIATVVIALFM